MAIAAGMESTVEAAFGSEALFAWGWRVPFIVAGIVIALIALSMHLFYRETPVSSMLRTR